MLSDFFVKQSCVRKRTAIAAFINTFFSLVLAFCSTAQAEGFERLSITSYGSFMHTELIPDALFFFDPIKEKDSFELRRALRNHDVNIMVLSSGGGLVEEGLNMAGIIHDKGLTTYVPKQTDGCYSACSYMFFAGKTRKVDGILAVHQMGYGKNSNQKAAIGSIANDTQYTVSEIIGFLNEFETPPWVYEKMFRSTDFYEFGDEDRKRIGVNGETLTATKIAEINTFIEDLEALISTEIEARANVFSFSKKNPDQVKVLQTLLNEAKCAAGPADGVWGRKTASAVSRFAKINDLKYSGHETIDEDFFIALASSEVRNCPPLPKPKIQHIMVRNWVLSMNCPNGQVSGNARLSYKRITSYGEEYSVSFSNNLGGIYTGVAYATQNGFQFSLRQTNGNSYSYGTGRFSKDKRLVNGKTEAGCAFVAAAR